MRFSLVSLCTAALALLVTSCGTVEHSYISDVADIPLKSATIPSGSWANSPLRANSLYILHGAESNQERENRIGDYYYVRWYDAEPEKEARLVMRYTQALTTSQVLTEEKVYSAPREGPETHLHRFCFSGPERKKRGDVLSWRIELYVDGKLCDSRQSYLWQEPMKK